jgi:5-hydroxyisourate hydrolase
MATISSHVLNSVDGTHADGLRVQCWRLLDDGSRELAFTVNSGADGRIGAEVDVDPNDPGREYELVFHTGEYFDAHGPAEDPRIMRSVVFRITMPDADAKYHMPIIASPHGYSTWWSQ